MERKSKMKSESRTRINSKRRRKTRIPHVPDGCTPLLREPSAS